MFDPDDFREIWSTVRKNKLRTVLTGFSVSWGIFMLILLLGAGNGLRNGVMYNFRDISMNQVEVWSGYTNKPWQGMQPGRLINFKETDIEVLKACFPEIDLFSADYWHGDTLRVDDDYLNGDLRGVFPDYAEINYVNVNTENGRFINDADMRGMRKTIVLSPRMAEVLFPGRPAVGEYVKTGSIAWQVVGVYDDEGKSSNPPAYIPFTTARALYGKGYGFSSLSFTLQGVVSEEANADFERRFRTVMARQHKFDPMDDNAIGIWNTADSFRMMNNVMNGITLFIWVVGIGTLIAGIMGVSNIMLISVRERTREFGIRKAIGAKPSSILRLVIMESILVTVLFGYLGMLGGIGLTELVNTLMEAADVGGQGNTIFLNPTVNIRIVVSALSLIVFAGVLAGYFPARKVVRISAIEAMREGE